jgi:hypothetical protein
MIFFIVKKIVTYFHFSVTWCNMATFTSTNQFLKKFGLGGIPNFKLVECESKATTQMKWMDFHT